MGVKVTIGLCIKHSGTRVETALQSISQQNYSHQDLSLVIVDEDEPNGIPENINRFAKETDIKTAIIQVQNRGLGASRQIAIENAEGNYIVWVDDDFVLKEDFVSKHVEFMEQNPKIAAAIAKETPIKTTFLSLFEYYLVYLGNLHPEVTPLGGFEIFRLKAVKQVGGFDPEIKGASEDQDLVIRLKKAGWTVSANPSAKYYRKFRPETWKAVWCKNLWYGYGRHFVYHKHKDQTARWELFFPLGFWTGLKSALALYKVLPEKTVFLLAPFCFFMNAAGFVGFFRADLEGYGHKQKTNKTARSMPLAF
ncbi:MAG: glycosyltransferase family 2 protein [Candidatus Bathyarchaeia archaeon]